MKHAYTPSRPGALLILGRVIAIVGGIVQAVLCLLILFSTAITAVPTGGTSEVINNELGLLLLTSYFTTIVEAFMIRLPLPAARQNIKAGSS